MLLNPAFCISWSCTRFPDQATQLQLIELHLHLSLEHCRFAKHLPQTLCTREDTEFNDFRKKSVYNDGKISVKKLMIIGKKNPVIKVPAPRHSLWAPNFQSIPTLFPTIEHSRNEWCETRTYISRRSKKEWTSCPYLEKLLICQNAKACCSTFFISFCNLNLSRKWFKIHDYVTISRSSS